MKCSNLITMNWDVHLTAGTVYNDIYEHLYYYSDVRASIHIHLIIECTHNCSAPMLGGVQMRRDIINKLIYIRVRTFAFWPGYGPCVLLGLRTTHSPTTNIQRCRQSPIDMRRNVWLTYTTYNICMATAEQHHLYLARTGTSGRLRNAIKFIALMCARAHTCTDCALRWTAQTTHIHTHTNASEQFNDLFYGPAGAHE